MGAKAPNPITPEILARRPTGPLTLSPAYLYRPDPDRRRCRTYLVPYQMPLGDVAKAIPPGSAILVISEHAAFTRDGIGLRVWNLAFATTPPGEDHPIVDLIADHA